MVAITSLGSVREGEIVRVLRDFRTALTGDVIQSVVSENVPTGIVVTNESHDGSAVFWTVTPGADTAGKSFGFTISVATTAGQTIKRDFHISILARRGA